jgi:hypothetical protein
MTAFIGRREFIALLGATAAEWPLAARAQQPAMPMIGFLRSTTFADAPHYVTAFRQGVGKLPERTRERDRQLKAEQRLTPPCFFLPRSCRS